jgi:hypothetical protein
VGFRPLTTIFCFSGGVLRISKFDVFLFDLYKSLYEWVALDPLLVDKGEMFHSVLFKGCGCVPPKDDDDGLFETSVSVLCTDVEIKIEYNAIKDATIILILKRNGPNGLVTVVMVVL